MYQYVKHGKHLVYFLNIQLQLLIQPLLVLDELLGHLMHKPVIILSWRRPPSFIMLERPHQQTIRKHRPVAFQHGVKEREVQLRLGEVLHCVPDLLECRPAFTPPVFIFSSSQVLWEVTNPRNVHRFCDQPFEVLFQLVVTVHVIWLIVLLLMRVLQVEVL